MPFASIADYDPGCRYGRAGPSHLLELPSISSGAPPYRSLELEVPREVGTYGFFQWTDLGYGSPTAEQEAQTDAAVVYISGRVERGRFPGWIPSPQTNTLSLCEVVSCSCHSRDLLRCKAHRAPRIARRGKTTRYHRPLESPAY